jgi:hypothetical protein
MCKSAQPAPSLCIRALGPASDSQPQDQGVRFFSQPRKSPSPTFPGSVHKSAQTQNRRPRPIPRVIYTKSSQLSENGFVLQNALCMRGPHSCLEEKVYSSSVMETIVPGELPSSRLLTKMNVIRRSSCAIRTSSRRPLRAGSCTSCTAEYGANFLTASS